MKPLLADKEWFKKTCEFWKLVKFWGEIFVIVGIAIEVVIAGVAAKDEWQTRQMVLRNKPRSMSLIQKRNMMGQTGLFDNKPPIRIFLNEEVPDSESLGLQLCDAFTKCGFRFNGFTTGLSSGHGILVGEYGETNLALVESIAGSLRSAGFLVKTNGGWSIFPKEIIVDIEEK